MSPHHTTYFCCAAVRAHVRSMSIDRNTLGVNIGSFVMVIFRLTRPYIFVHRSSIFTYIPVVMFCAEDFCLHHRWQAPDNMRTAQRYVYNPPAQLAVVYIVYVACPRYAAASCFRRSLSSVTPPYHIFLLCHRCVGAFIGRVTLDGNTGTFGLVICLQTDPYILVHGGSFFTYIQFLRRRFVHVTDRKTPNKMREARRRVYDPAAQQQQQQQQQAGPCARAVSSLYCGELLSSSPVLSSCSLVLNMCAIHCSVLQY